MMLALLSTLLGKVIQWVTSILPASPFASAVGSVDPSMATGIAWLNTFVPVQQIIVLLTAWVGALLLVVLFRFVKRFTVDKIVSVFGLR